MKRILSIAVPLVILASLVATSCKVTEYVKVPEIRHDTLQIFNTRVDSVRLYDSISVVMKNDTFFIEKIRYRDRYHRLHDSVFISKTDTIVKVQTVEVEKKLGAKDRIYHWIGKYLWWLILLVIVYIVLRVCHIL